MQVFTLNQANVPEKGFHPTLASYVVASERWQDLQRLVGSRLDMAQGSLAMYYRAPFCGALDRFQQSVPRFMPGSLALRIETTEKSGGRGDPICYADATELPDGSSDWKHWHEAADLLMKRFADELRAGTAQRLEPWTDPTTRPVLPSREEQGARRERMRWRLSEKAAELVLKLVTKEMGPPSDLTHEIVARCVAPALGGCPKCGACLMANIDCDLCEAVAASVKHMRDRFDAAGEGEQLPGDS